MPGASGTYVMLLKKVYLSTISNTRLMIASNAKGKNNSA